MGVGVELVGPCGGWTMGGWGSSVGRWVELVGPCAEELCMLALIVYIAHMLI